MGKNATLFFLSALAFLSVCTGYLPNARAGDNLVVQRTEPACKPTQSNDQNCAELGVARRSLTVIGLGQITAPADVALLEFRFGNREAPDPSDSNSPGLSLQDARKITETALQPTIKALTAAGIPARDITIQTSSLQNPNVLVRVDKPTQERLQQVVQAVDQSIKSSRSLFLQSIGAGYAVNTCQTLQRSARRLALRDAQDQLKTLAQDVGVQSGELLSVTVLPFEGSPNSVGCGSKVGVPNSPVPIAINEATPPYDPSDQPEVQVRSRVSVTHAIKTGVGEERQGKR